MTTDETQAIAEVAATAGKAIDAARDAGGFVARTVGTVPEDLIGLAGGDWLHEQRRRNRAKMEAKTEAILAGVEQSRISDASPSLVMPLLEVAANESREKLQDLWAALLANAMLDGGQLVRRDFFEAVSKLEPVDVLVLEVMSRNPNGHEASTVPESVIRDKFFEDQRAHLRLSRRDWNLSVQALLRLGCIGGETLTEFGEALVDACRSPLG